MIYLEELAQRVGSARVFTNTNGELTYEAQLLASIFPNVRFIFLKRNLEDNIWRMYQRTYRAGFAYSYDLKAARDYVAWYHQMIDLMAKKLPDIVRIINYEDMIANPAAAVRVAADLCGLPKTESLLPAIGDDRGCAEPYHNFIWAELTG
jgi:Sulfotransferase family